MEASVSKVHNDLPRVLSPTNLLDVSFISREDRKEDVLIISESVPMLELGF